MSLGVDNEALYYRDAFRKTDEFAAIIEVAPRGRLIDASDRLLSACHLDRASAIGRPLDRLFNPATAARLIGVARAAVANENQPPHANDAKPPSTHFLHRRMVAVPLSPTLAFLKAIDSPPNGSAQRDTLLNEVGALSDGLIYIYDVERQRTSFMNSNLAHLLGAKPGASRPLSRIMALIHPDDVDDVMRHVEGFAFLPDGKVSKHAYRLLRRSDNAWRRIENSYAALTRDPGGLVQSVIGCAFDVTDHDVTFEHATSAEERFEVEDIERRRIARELHDSTAQHLVAADLMVGAHLRETGAKSDDVLTSARATLGQALREIRTLSFLLHPPGRHAAGFAKMLRSFADGFAQRSDLALSIDMQGADEQLPPAVELILFRICQEAFMNVRRHANASRVALRFYLRGAQAVLEVEDDGVGVGQETALGVGIESMRARLHEIGGALTIENTGNGTLVRASAPRNLVN